MSWINKLDMLILPSDVIIDLTEVYKHQGRQLYHDEIIKGDIKTIIAQTIEKDIYYFDQLLELEVAESRLRALSRKDINPRNNTEKTILNFKDVLKNIFDNYKTFEFSTNEVQAIHSHMFKNIANTRFATEEQKTKFSSQRTKNKRLELDELFEQSHLMFKKNEYEKLLLVILIFIDFYNIKGFKEKNEYTSLVLLHLLLFRAGFDNFKYISFYEYITKNFSEYKSALIAASFSYEEGLSQPLPLMRFFLKALKETFVEVEQVVKNHQFDQTLNKSYNIQNTVYKLPEVFQKDDIRRVHPYVSETTINRTLLRLRDEGVIKPLGKGRSAKWIRIQEREKFDVEEQMTLDMFNES